MKIVVKNEIPSYESGRSAQQHKYQSPPHCNNSWDITISLSTKTPKTPKTRTSSSYPDYKFCIDTTRGETEQQAAYEEREKETYEVRNT
jgi:hypothetical protein